MKQKKVVMCFASIDGSNDLTLIGVPFEGIACFVRTQHPNQWDVHLKEEYKIKNINKLIVAKTHYNDYVNDSTIEEMCMIINNDD